MIRRQNYLILIYDTKNLCTNKRGGIQRCLVVGSMPKTNSPVFKVKTPFFPRQSAAMQHIEVGVHLFREFIWIAIVFLYIAEI
jgi:hypothetical protein